jgi:hypothetical protein
MTMDLFDLGSVLMIDVPGADVYRVSVGVVVRR